MKKNAISINCLQVKAAAIQVDRNYIDRRRGLSRSGNWCGHFPDSPRFFAKPEHHRSRPKILTWASEAWRRFYSSPNSCFKEIRFTRKSTRQQRSESREAVASIAEVILHYTELASLRVGVPHKTEGFTSLGIEFLAKKAGIGLKRAQRAVAVMKRAGYLKLIERFEIKGEEFIGLAAVKSLTPSFFKACGVNLQALAAQRRLARKRLNKNRMRVQEDIAPVNVLDFTIPHGNRKDYFDAMRSFVQTDESKEIKERDKSRRRRKSLEKTRE